MTGRVVIDSNGDRIHEYVIWTLEPGQNEFRVFAEIDPLLPDNEVSGDFVIAFFSYYFILC